MCKYGTVSVRFKQLAMNCVLQEHPELMQLIKLAIEKSVNEWITPVIERAIKIAVTTCEQIVKKVQTYITYFSPITSRKDAS